MANRQEAPVLRQVQIPLLESSEADQHREITCVLTAKTREQPITSTGADLRYYVKCRSGTVFDPLSALAVFLVRHSGGEPRFFQFGNEFLKPAAPAGAHACKFHPNTGRTVYRPYLTRCSKG